MFQHYGSGGEQTGDHLVFASAVDLATAIRHRGVSSSEVVEAHLTQIAKHNAALNAIVTLDEAGARRRAHEADAALARGEVWGPLHGVPITLEDLHPTAGLRSTWGGYRPLADHVPTEDGTVVSRLKRAGAILLGKTNGPAIWPDAVFERPKNPWGVDRMVRGSSAGSAAALASGFSPLDVGGDTAGSVLGPAHDCGIWGMRPTEGRVPITGIFFLDPVRKFRVMSVAGPMARSATDLRLALEIVAGPDGRDSTVPAVPWREVQSPALSDLRVAWAASLPETPVARDIRGAIERLVQELDRQGARVEQRLPGVDFAELTRDTEALFGLMAGAFMTRPEGSPPVTIEDYLTALDRRDSFIAAFERFFDDWDVLLIPVGVSTAPHHGEPKIPSMIDGERVPDPAGGCFSDPCMPSPATGCPSVAFPLGQDHDGLPVGAQILGRRWDDERLLEIAERLGELIGGFERPPGY